MSSFKWNYEEENFTDLRKLKRQLKDIIWQAPTECWVKLNFDAAIRDEKTSIAVVCRDYKGVLLMAWAEQIDPERPILGEAKADLCAIRRASQEGSLECY